MSTVNAEHGALRAEEATDAFGRLSTLLDRFEPVDAVLSKLVDSAMATIPDTGSATVTLLRVGRPRTLASTSSWASGLDEVQYTADDGPCLRAARTGRLVRLDAADGDKWPEFCAAAQAVAGQSPGDACGAGVSRAGSSRTQSAVKQERSGASPIGIPPPLVGEEVKHALSTPINHAYRHQQARLLVDQLGDALDNRDVIGQAKGLLMARHRCGADEAFGHLREASQRANIKLHEIAARLVASETGEQRS